MQSLSSFNWKIYNELNPDLKIAGVDTEQKLLAHWKRYGCRENRPSKVSDINPNFNLITYKQENSDLVLLNSDDYELHWIRNIYNKPNDDILNKIDTNTNINNIDWQVFRDLNSEIKKKELNKKLECEKYILDNINKLYSFYDVYPDFISENYLKLNSDLSNKLMNKDNIERHWILHGRKQGKIYKEDQNKILSFHVLIATGGRKTIIHMLRSLLPQLIDTDYLTIVYDGPNTTKNIDTVKTYLTKFKCKTNIIVESKNLGYWGHGIRNKHNNLEGDFIMHADDDDFYLPDIFIKLRRLCNDKSKIYIFPIELKTGRLITCNYVKCNNISTQCGIIPMNYNLQSKWAYKYGGDYDFYLGLEKKYSKHMIFMDQCIYTMNVNSNYIFDWEIYRILNPDLHNYCKKPQDYKNQWLFMGYNDCRLLQITDIYPDFKFSEHISALHKTKKAVELNWLNHNNITKLIEDEISNYKMSYRLEFNLQIYRELNPDLITANLNTEQQIVNHWCKNGHNEKRKICIQDLTPNFDWQEYKESNPDLVNLNLKTKLDYELHWIKSQKNDKLKNKNIMPIIQSKVIDNTNNINKDSIEIVMARYNETIDYLNDKPFNNYPVILYNKGSTIPEIKNNIKAVIQLPNVGRCDHTYLYHIINNYDNLADITIFLPGSCLDSNKKKYTYNVINFVNKNKTTCLHGKKISNVKKDLYNFKLDKWSCSNIENRLKNPETKLELCDVRPFGKWFECNFNDLVVEVICYCGIFAVSKKHIIQHPKSHYENILKYLSTHSNPEAGHYVERAWGAIFYPYPTSCIYYGI